MNRLNGAPLDKVLAFVRKWALVLLIVFVGIVLMLLYVLFQILAKYTLLIFMGLAVYAYIKRHSLKAHYLKVKSAVDEYRRNNNL